MLNRIALALLVLLLQPQPARADSAAVTEFSLDDRVEILRDAGGQLAFDDVRQDPAARGFERNPQPVFNAGYTPLVHWFRVSIPAQLANGPWLLELAYPLLDQVDFYLPQPDGSYQKVETGDQRPFRARPIRHRNFIVPLTLEDRTPRTVYLRVHTESTLQLPLHLWTPQHFLEKSEDEQYLLGLYYGIMLVMILYNLLVYLLVRDISYLFYILYIGVSATLQAALNGLSAQYVFGDSAYWTNLSLPLSLAATIIFATLFTHSFLDTPRNLPVLNRALWALFAVTALAAVGVFFVPYAISIKVTSVLAATMTIMFFATGLRALIRGVRAARFFMMAWGVFLVSIQVRVLLGFGLMPSNILTNYAPQIGASLEVALLALALADRITIERQEKERLGRERAVAQAATEAKSEFLARMSHEIRTPINAVTGFTDLALRAADEPQRLDYLRQIRAASRSLLALINDILDMSRVEAGKLSLSVQDFRLAPLLESVSDLFAAQAADKGVALEVVADPRVPAGLRGDPARLEQVLVNLVANALKFTDRGRVELRAGLESVAGDEVQLRFSVSDTGIGIPAPQRVRLFEPFSQGDESITRRYGGTGLGLAICRQLVELMGGEIRVDSVVGEGSTFHFTARLGRASGVLHDTQPDETSLPHFAGAQVLVVEDNALNQRLAQEMLVVLGAQVTLAGHGGEALEAVQRGTFAAILMDVQMPEMDGLEATRRIRLLPAYKTVPIIAMTAHALAGSREQCETAGMSDFIGKPVTARGLAVTLARWLPITARPETVAARAPPAGPLPELLPGVKLGQALRRLGGNDGLLRTSLAEFRRDYAGCADQLEAALTRADASGAARIAHTLKGVAANLSMADLERAAREAETELFDRGQLEPTRLQAVREALAVVVESCAPFATAFATPGATTASLSDPQLREAFMELQRLVGRNDFAAQEALCRCGASLRERVGGELVDELAAALARFDFSAARAPLAALSRRLAGDMA